MKPAKQINNCELDLENLKSLDYSQAKQELLISCLVLDIRLRTVFWLFSLEKLEAFPIDVWMKRAATQLYAKNFDPDSLNGWQIRAQLPQNSTKPLAILVANTLEKMLVMLKSTFFITCEPKKITKLSLHNTQRN